MTRRGKRRFVFEELLHARRCVDRGSASPDRPGRILLQWLSDDDDRRALYETVRHLNERALDQRRLAEHPDLVFKSRSRLRNDPCPPLDSPPEQGAVDVRLVFQRDAIEAILRDKERFGALPYRVLGSGDFMLGLDPGAAPTDWHAEQRAEAGRFLQEAMRHAAHHKLVDEAIRRAAIIPLARKQFDAADFAAQVALRYCALLLGFAADDHGLLQEAATKAYRALTYQIIGRHFATEPDTVPAANAAMARLARRADELMRDYDRLERYPLPAPTFYDAHGERDRWPEGVDPPALLGLGSFQPLLKRWALEARRLSGEQLATCAAGMIAGTVGNVQASVCIALDDILNDPERAAASIAWPPRRDVEGWIADALRRNPPVAFLPRVVRPEAKKDPNTTRWEVGQELILCLGAATMPPPAPGAGCPWQDPLLFGLKTEADPMKPNGGDGVHACLGAGLAWPLVVRTVERVLRLPGLAQLVEPDTLEPQRLEKRWGFACERYPLQYRRDLARVQQPLQVIMRIKPPVAENAAAIRRAIQDGAPRIEAALREARHVHFAWFQLVAGDTQLALQTVYDGDFDDYVLHFALKVDEVFDSLLRYLDDAPPLPVRDHPEAFVDAMRRFDRTPAAGYFFSAYPAGTVPDIVRLLARRAP